MIRHNFGSPDKPAISGRAVGEKSGLFRILALAGVILAGLVGAGPVMGGEQSAATPPDDPNGTANIVFLDGRQTHFYAKNRQAGQLLILTGVAHNNYNEPRGFIKISGYLLSADEKKLADRMVYAGNVLTENELADLSIDEIAALLLVEGGRDGVNVNVSPGADIPFMIVFDNIPDGTEQYRIDPVSSKPAN